MTWKKTFDELLSSPTPRTFVSEAIVDGVVDFVIVEAVVKESATERARRRWNMPAQEEPNLSACAKLKALE
jgi:hypothetical protein